MWTRAHKGTCTGLFLFCPLGPWSNSLYDTRASINIFFWCLFFTLKRSSSCYSPPRCTSSMESIRVRWRWSASLRAPPACCPMPGRTAARSQPKRRVRFRAATAGSYTRLRARPREPRAPWRKRWSRPAPRGTLPFAVSSHGEVGIRSPRSRTARAGTRTPQDHAWRGTVYRARELPKAALILETRSNHNAQHPCAWERFDCKGKNTAGKLSVYFFKTYNISTCYRILIQAI